MKSLMASDRGHFQRFVTQQIHYTLEAREAEYELLPLSVDQGVGVTVWSPLAAGLLSGKHTRQQPVAPDSRQDRGWSEPPIRDQERLWRIVDVLNDIAAAHDVEAAQIALAWTLTRPAVASLVVGGTSTAQFEANFRALDLTLSPEDLARLDAVSRPPQIYPLWHQSQFASPRFGPADKSVDFETGNP